MSEIRWVRRPGGPPEDVQRLAADLGTDQPFPEVLADILLARGVATLDAARAFFVPRREALHDPFLMRDMDIAVARLLRARTQGERVLLFGDYDVDGTSAVTLLMLALSECGFDVHYYIPDRYTEGYGLSYRGIEHAAKLGAGLIITLDCGIKSTDKVRFATAQGIDMIICDHHTPGDELPGAVAVLDPKRPDCGYPYKELTGCGVGYKLLEGLLQRLPADLLPRPDYDLLARYCDLITLSIACDIVPITGENRTIAYHGLQKLRSDPMPGIQALMAQSGQAREWDISDLVFFIGPRINAAGRLEHASAAVEVLLARDARLADLAAALQHANDARKDLDRSMTLEALTMIETDPAFDRRSSTVLYHPDWHKGVIGIVASRVIETHYRPTILLTRAEGKLVGSARSVAGFDLYQALEACEGHLLQWGGHKFAAGLSLREEQLEVFSDAFDAAVSAQITPEQRIPLLYIDGELRLDQLDARFLRLLNRMEPFGPENRRPVFIARDVKVLHSTVMKEEHLKLVVQQGTVMVEAIGFGMAAKWQQLGQEHLDIAFQPFINSWNDKHRINLRLKDFRTATS
ncbi:MAG: single-stranded-DNA-specific exonuclease RecJ [Bacteroidia bacterium]